MDYTVEFSAEFDMFNIPPSKGRVEIRKYEKYLHSRKLVMVNESEECIILMDIAMDQWGVWYSVLNASFMDNSESLNHHHYSTSIAQEDGTRSFLDALIKALTQLRNSYEVDTKDATLLKADVQEFSSED